MNNFKKLTEKYSYYESIDLWFGKRIAELDGRDHLIILITAALISRLTREGNICINLESYAGKRDIRYGYNINSFSFFFPDIAKWLQILNTSPCIGKPGEYRPLILNKNRLYMYKFWLYQKKIVEYIKNNKIQESLKQYNIGIVKQIFSRIFNIKDPKFYPIILAGASALLKNFTVIIGGPGTGKTTALANILAMLINIEIYKIKRSYNKIKN